MDTLIRMIPEEYKPYVAFALSSVMLWHFYGDVIKAMALNVLQLNNKKETA